MTFKGHNEEKGNNFFEFKVKKNLQDFEKADLQTKSKNIVLIADLVSDSNFLPLF